MWKDDAGDMRTAANDFTVRVYVSSQDRIFSSFEVARWRRRHYIGSTTNEVSGSDDNKPHWKFDGDTLVADQQFQLRGARRLIMSFADDFKSCSIGVVVAKEAGSARIEKPGRELEQLAITSQSCTVQSGNVFANWSGFRVV